MIGSKISLLTEICRAGIVGSCWLYPMNLVVPVLGAADAAKVSPRVNSHENDGFMFVRRELFELPWQLFPSIR